MRKGWIVIVLVNCSVTARREQRAIFNWWKKQKQKEAEDDEWSLNEEENLLDSGNWTKRENLGHFWRFNLNWPKSTDMTWPPFSAFFLHLSLLSPLLSLQITLSQYSCSSLPCFIRTQAGGQTGPILSFKTPPVPLFSLVSASFLHPSIHPTIHSSIRSSTRLKDPESVGILLSSCVCVLLLLISPLTSSQLGRM